MKLHTTESNVQIAKKLRVSEKCVRTTFENYRLSQSVDEKSRSGRPSVLSNRE